MRITDVGLRLRPNPKVCLTLATVGLMLFAPCISSVSFAQTAEPPAKLPAETPPPKSPSWRDRLRHGFHINIQVAAPVSRRPSNTDPNIPHYQDQQVIDQIFNRNDGNSTTKVHDITQLSNRADVVVDPTCKEIVAPFGTLDSAASLAVLATKVALLRQLGGGPQMSSMELIRMAALQLNWLPASTERKIGERMLVSSSDMILDEDHNRASKQTYSNAQKTLVQVLAQIHEPLPYTFRIYVLKVKQGNAASLPGGTILVDEDLFDRNWNPEVAYFKVAHEVSHVLQRHQTHMYQARLVDGITAAGDLRKLIATAKNQPAGIVGRVMGLKHLMVEFTASQELQADACAVRLVRSEFAQADLGGMQQAIIESLGTIDPVAPMPTTLPPQVSTLVDGQFERHPNSSERRKNLDVMFAARN